MRIKIHVVFRLDILIKKNKTGYGEDGIPRYVLFTLVRKINPLEKLVNCQLFKTSQLWHMALLLPICSAQTNGTISYPSLLEFAFVFFCPLRWSCFLTPQSVHYIITNSNILPTIVNQCILLQTLSYILY